MKFIHVADIHANRERLQQTLEIIKTLKQKVKEHDVDCIIFAGDFFDSVITNTLASGFSEIVYAIKDLNKSAPCCFVYGTASHEPNGCLEVFKAVGCQVYEDIDILNCIVDNTQILFIPEPRLSKNIGKKPSTVVKEIEDKVCKTLKRYSSPDTNLIVAYHGEIKGALYQNGQIGVSEYALTQEFLKSLNAKYYACGHIHSPQKVFENCYYAGSTCPLNFGETHKGAMNLVEIGEKTTVKIIDFNFPQNKTLEMRIEDLDSLKTEDYSDYNVKFILRCTSEQKDNINQKEVEQIIKEKLQPTKLALHIIKDTKATVRTTEIAKHSSYEEKLKEYCKVMGLKPRQEVFEKLELLQNQQLIKYSYPTHSFELLSLDLRGAIGIKDGSGKDYIHIDFDSYNNGVLAITGKCGTGKSTLIENAQPFSKMLSRSGKLQDHFYLADSHRILVYKDETGLFYKLTILIDGEHKNGSCKYYVETSTDGENYKAIPDTDGSFNAYNNYIEKTFGNIEVFLATAFITKEPSKDAPDLAQATKQNKIDLFSSLVGTDTIKNISDIAKEARKECEKTLSVEKLQLDSKSKDLEDINELNERKKAEEEKIKSVEKEIEKLKENIAVLEKKDAEYKEYQSGSKRKELEKRLTMCKSNFALQKETYDIYTFVEDNKERIKKSTEVTDDHANLTYALEESQSCLAEYSKQKLDMTKLQNEITRDIDKLEITIEKLKNKIKPEEGVCPVCGQSVKCTDKDKNHNLEIEEEIKKQQARCVELQKELEVLNGQCNALETKINNKAEHIGKVKAEILDLEVRISEEFWNITHEHVKALLCVSEEERKKLIKQTEELDFVIKNLQKEIEDYDKLPMPPDVSEDLKVAKWDYNEEEHHIINIKTEIKLLEHRIDTAKKLSLEVEEQKKKVKELTLDCEDLLFIEESFGNKGIVLLELENAAPEITEIANQILNCTEDNHFAIEIKTVKQGRSKSVDDFSIMVTDTETGRVKALEMLSSGEKIWIKQAIYYAFSVIRMNKTGFNFRIVFTDESDGSLDSELRQKYLQMLEYAQTLVNARLNVLITHSQEIKDVVEQIYEF